MRISVFDAEVIDASKQATARKRRRLTPSCRSTPIGGQSPSKSRTRGEDYSNSNLEVEK